LSLENLHPGLNTAAPIGSLSTKDTLIYISSSTWPALTENNIKIENKMWLTRVNSKTVPIEHKTVTLVVSRRISDRQTIKLSHRKPVIFQSLIIDTLYLFPYYSNP
jgi:hypothetical protein